jgi:H+/Cl- antiporter ClcA
MPSQTRAPEVEPQGADRLGDFVSVNRRLILTSILAVAIGCTGALVADALLLLIGLFTNLFFYGRLAFTFVSPAGNHLGYLVIGVPVVGGLIVGVMARFGSPRIRGHGIPEAIESILMNKSKVEPGLAVLKPLSSAISIGTGGPFGAEGPIIMTGGAVGSVVGQFLHLTSMERKTLLVAGAAAGMAATFNTPVAAALLAVELLLFEWKPRSLIPVGLASVSATALRGVLISTKPIFPIPPTPLPSVAVVAWSVVVGVAAGALSTVLTWSVYGSEDFFKKLPLHWMWWPAIGGLGIGIGGLIAPRALGVGYDTIDALLLGQVVAGVVAVLVIVKAAIWAFSLGSGTSGGVLAPLMIMGGCFGALEAHLLPVGSVTLWVLVSVGATIGGTMRSPFTGTVFALELTHDVNALLPLLAAAMTADFFTVFSMKRSILTEKVARRGVHVSREYSVDALEQVRVRAVMNEKFTAVQADVPVAELMRRLAQSNSAFDGVPVVDGVGFLHGFVAPEKLFSIAAKGGYESLTVRDILSTPLVVAFPDEPLKIGVDRMLEANLHSLVVVDPSNHQKVLGILSQSGILRARALLTGDETEKERALFLHALSPGESLRRALNRLRRRSRGSKDPSGAPA